MQCRAPAVAETNDGVRCDKQGIITMLESKGAMQGTSNSGSNWVRCGKQGIITMLKNKGVMQGTRGTGSGGVL